MKNTFGQTVGVTLFGESHGPMIGAVIDGLPAGVPVDETAIAQKLSLRRPAGEYSTARVEKDAFSIVSGVLNGRTCGTPVTVLIPNEDTRSQDYHYGPARPGHADYTAFVKYHGCEDYRGGGHFSGRITAALVAAGAILQQALERKGILICTRVCECAGVKDRAFSDLAADLAVLQNKPFAVLDENAEQAMRQKIAEAKAAGDSVGGILETVITGLPAGVGEPWFDSAESVLSHALFSIPAVKGVAFGDGFALAGMRGSEANDPMRMKDGKVVTLKNSNGGVLGGITNGMPVVVKTVIKPTPTVFAEQQTVDFVRNENTTIKANGRHDPCIVHRARAVADAVCAVALCDLLAVRYGTEYLR